MPARRPHLSPEIEIPEPSLPESRSRPPTELEIELFARARHGIVTIADLDRLGLGERAARARARQGRLHRLHRGVYAVERPTAKGRWTAAVVACGPHAVLSHASAAALWDLGPDRASVHVTVPGAGRAHRAGLAVHNGLLDASEVTSVDDIPCTTVARTLLDVAATAGRRRVEQAVDRAEELRLFDLGELRALLDHRRGQRGTAVLRSVLADYEPTATASVAEQRLLSLIRLASLPEPEVNAWMPLPEGGGYRPDFLWRSHRLVVEVDGRTHHARRRAFEHDRRRDRRLALAGYETRRYAAREILRDPDQVVTELSTFIGRASSG